MGGFIAQLFFFLLASDPPPRAPTKDRPGFPFGFWRVLWVPAGACQRHGVGVFLVQFFFFFLLLTPHRALRRMAGLVSFWFYGDWDEHPYGCSSQSMDTGGRLGE